MNLIIGKRYKFKGCSEIQKSWGNYTGDITELVVGREYKVINIEVHSWHTKIYLEGLEGSFNSVCFE